MALEIKLSATESHLAADKSHSLTLTSMLTPQQQQLLTSKNKSKKLIDSHNQWKFDNLISMQFKQNNQKKK